MSITTTSGTSARRDLDRLLAGRGLADDLGVGDRLEQGSEAAPEERVVVGDEDPDWRLMEAASSIASRGSDAVTSVPPPALEPISQVPPISAARSFIVWSPIPVEPRESPPPSSAISSRSTVGSTATRTVQVRA